MKIYSLLAAFFSLWLFLPGAYAINFPEKPSENDFYVDQANIISPETRQEINQIISKLWQEKQIPLVVVTIPSLAAEEAKQASIESYTRALFDFWGLGSEKNNNGILLLISRDDHRARIELGQSFAHHYDKQAEEIMRDRIIPEFKKGNYSAGILQGVTALDHLARDEYVSPPLPRWMIFVAIGVIILFIFIVISLFRSGHSGWGWALLALMGIFLLFCLRKLSKAARSTDMFGGGSSGGGGSTGSW